MVKHCPGCLYSPGKNKNSRNRRPIMGSKGGAKYAKKHIITA